MRANLELTHGALFSQRVLLALVEAGSARDEAYRIVQELAQRAWDEGVPLRELLAADERAAGLDLDAIFDYSALRRHAVRSSAAGGVAERRRPRRPRVAGSIAPRERHRRPAPDRQREGARDVRAGRRLATVAGAAADGRQRPHLHLRRGASRRRSPTRARCSRGCRRSGSRGPRTIVANHLISATRGRARRRARPRAGGAPAARCCPVRVRRARLHHRLGLEGLPGDRARSRASSCRRACASPSGCPSRSSRPARRPTRATTRRSTSSAAAELVGDRALMERVADVAVELYSFAAEHARARGVILADTKFEFGLDGDGELVARRRGAHARLLALLARARATSVGRGAAELRQAVRARLGQRERLGHAGRPRPRSPRRSSRARARATSRRTSASPASRSRPGSSAATGAA